MPVLVPALLCLVLASNQQPSVEAGGQGVADVPAVVASDPAPQAPPNQDVPQEDRPETPDGKPPTPVHTGVRALFAELKDDITHLPSRPNLYIAGVGGGLALGAHTVDREVSVRVLNQHEIVDDLFAPGKYFGGTSAQMALSIGTWVIGRATHKPKLSHLGMDLLRAQALTEMMVEPLKFATRRERPDGSNHQSFPSGHAAITFAAAAVIERHLGWRNSIVAYAVASYVAASRLHDNRHYLSDVVFGAAVGSIAGRTVTRHGRDIWTLAPTAVPGGVAIMATRTAF